MKHKKKKEKKLVQEEIKRVSGRIEKTQSMERRGRLSEILVNLQRALKKTKR
jgi:hypothetical protein